MSKQRNDLSWGRFPAVTQNFTALHWRNDKLPKVEGSLLPYGKGRSYGDSCLNDGNYLIQTNSLNKFIAFDRSSGKLKCEAGVTLAEILDLVVPYGWFLPVTPGTKYVTVGGAIANDVHGKNHHVTGTFGCHVRQFELLRSDGSRLQCSAKKNADWYAATIGGLGLTGMITWAELHLKKINNAYISVEEIRYDHVDEFRELVNDSESWEYTVAWVDAIATGKKLGRGLFMRGEHAGAAIQRAVPNASQKKLMVPFPLPNFALNGLSVNAFNQLYYWKGIKRVRSFLSHYDPFFYPLDAVLQWNRIYGSRGFFQYQCVVPNNDNFASMLEVMQCIANAKAGSFLTVLKEFGDVKSPGMLSFPCKGTTFALDFPNKGEKTLKLMNELDAVVRSAGGKVYPAKDARMSPESFQTYYPNWLEFEKFIDPKFSSSFWRRVTGK